MGFPIKRFGAEALFVKETLNYALHFMLVDVVPTRSHVFFFFSTNHICNNNMVTAKETLGICTNFLNFADNS